MSSLRLPSLPSLKSSVASVRCGCGCPLLCHNRFRPGHDAKLLGYVKRVTAGVFVKDGTLDDQLDALAGYVGERSADMTAAELGFTRHATEEATGTDGE